ncbi:hypothetical protein ACSBR2_017824 [Camellia fascicularis]
MTHFDKAVTLGETIKTEINGCACKLPTYPFARNQTSVVLGQNIEAEFKPEAEAEPESLPLRVRPFDPERYHHQTHILPTSGGIKCFTEFAHGAAEDLLLREPDSHLSAIAIEVEFFICLVLTILGYIPGIVYALYAMLCVDRDMTRVDYRPLA